jgi:hypothetical protein
MGKESEKFAIVEIPELLPNPLLVSPQPVIPGATRPRARMFLANPVLVDHLLENEATDLGEEGVERFGRGEVDLWCLWRPQAPSPALGSQILDVPIVVRWEAAASVPDLRRTERVDCGEPELQLEPLFDACTDRRPELANDPGLNPRPDIESQLRLVADEVGGVGGEPLLHPLGAPRVTGGTGGL